MMRNKQANNAGFTIHELLVVILFTAVVFVLVFLRFQSVNKNYRNNERRADVRYIETKLDSYYRETGSYPSNLSDLSDIASDALVDPLDGRAYYYNTSPAGCSTKKDDCTSYKIRVDWMEGGADVLVVSRTIEG